ncbi:MAG: hypothetical protein R2883_06375 [Caldisericia bacterium]
MGWKKLGCIDGSIFNLTKDNFKDNPINISKNHVTSNHLNLIAMITLILHGFKTWGF